jgi:hypothetical protein
MPRPRTTAITLDQLRPKADLSNLRRARRITGSKCPYVPVGWDAEGKVAWIIDREGSLQALTLHDLRYNPLTLHCGIVWLRFRYPVLWSNKQPSGHFDVQRARDDLVAACQAMGPFNHTMLPHGVTIARH